MKNRNYFRTMAACMAVTMLLGMTACGSKDAVDKGAGAVQGTEAAKEEAPKAQETVSVGEFVSMNSYVVDDLVTLGDYKNLTVSIAPVEVDEADVQEMMDSICLNYLTADSGITDRAVANGDTVSLNFAGYIDGEQFEGGTSQGYELTIGSHSFIDGFEEGLVGIMPGEERTLKLAFPNSYWNADYAGKPVDFVCTVNFIYPTEYTDEYIASLGIENVTDKETLREYCFGYIYADNQQGYEEELQYALIMAALEACPMKGEVPADVVEYYGKTARDFIETYAEMYSMDPNDFTTTYYGVSLDDYANNYGTSVGQQYIVCQAVANAEGLNISDEELDEDLVAYAADHGVTVEELLLNETREDFRDYFMVMKVLGYLADNAIITDAE